MALFTPFVPVRYAAPLLDVLRDTRGNLRGQILADAELTDADLSMYAEALPMRQFEQLVHSIAEHTGRTDIGFEFGRRMHPQLHGPVSMVMRQCETLDQVFRLIVRYSRLITPIFSFQYKAVKDHVEITYRPTAPMSSLVLQVFMETHAVGLNRTLETLLGDRMTRYDVYLTIPEPPHIERYRALPYAKWHFGNKRLPLVRLVFPKALLQLPVNWGDMVSRTIEPLDLHGMQSTMVRTRECKEWVRMMLREAQGYQPSAAELAEMLSVSAHTLARDLAREGVSFRTMGKEIRHTRACKMLEDPELSVAEIAQRLGYSDSANFCHAFLAMSGQSPTAYRNALA